ncbi:MAG: hydrogenase nickel incorporation protein HypB [Spirochaetales bacterium]|nr:hydrogenase nickel incorporation protein HypB [Spirochaetales bacterium]
MSNLEIKVYKNLMGANEEWAVKIRSVLKEKGVRMVNIIGSPGCGKTSLLEYIGKHGTGEKTPVPFAVLEGDVETTKDAERLNVLKIPVSQLITSGGCHLEAKMVYHALCDLDLDRIKLVVVENVGNLVCPAEFDLGEDAKIAVLSITEGEDKPVKYPMLFREAKACVLTKIDLLPHLKFDLPACLEYVKQVNGSIPVFQVSSYTGEGMDDFTRWFIGV